MTKKFIELDCSAQGNKSRLANLRGRSIERCDPHRKFWYGAPDHIGINLPAQRRQHHEVEGLHDPLGAVRCRSVGADERAHGYGPQGSYFAV